MCGVFGAFGSKIDPQVIRTLGVLNQERGSQSAGFFDARGWWMKCEYDIKKYLQNPDVTKNIVNMAGTGVVCGHTRACTRGSVSVDNAHPFCYGEKGKEVVLAHNGVVDAPKEYDVDSMYACDLLSKAKPGDYQTALGDLAGWYTLTWVDNRNKTLYFLNWKCVLHFANFKHTVYYSSTAEALQTALGVKECHATKPEGEVWSWDGKKFRQLKKFTGKDRFVNTRYCASDYQTSMGVNSYISTDKPTGKLRRILGKWYAATHGGWKYLPLNNSDDIEGRFPKPFDGEERWLFNGEKPDINYSGTAVRQNGTPVYWLAPNPTLQDFEDSELGVVVNNTPGVADTPKKSVFIADDEAMSVIRHHKGDQEESRVLVLGSKQPTSVINSLTQLGMCKDITGKSSHEMHQLVKAEMAKRYKEAVEEDAAAAGIVEDDLAKLRRDSRSRRRKQLEAEHFSEDKIEHILFQEGFYDGVSYLEDDRSVLFGV